MLNKQKQAFRLYCKRHKHLYRIFSQWFERRTNRALRDNRKQWGIDNDLVVFSSYNMRAYNDNPKYISEALHKMRPQTLIVWLFKDVEAAKAKYAIPDYARCVEWKMPMSNFFLGRARVIVDNWQKPDWLRLGREQVYLFSPHHDRSLKSGGFLKKDRLYNRLVEAHASVVTVGSDFNKRFLRMAAHFKGPYLDVGLPRNDILVRDDPADEARIRRCLGIDAETKILLFAPTYRDLNRRESSREIVKLDIGHVLDVLEQTTRERWVCLYRAHYLSLGLNMDQIPISSQLMDVTDYPEMAELLRVSDALISDYSCTAGDFALRGKPIWLYVADIDEYTKYSRKLYVNPLDTPYWCARTPTELETLIRQTTPDKAAKNCQDVLEYYGAHETGRASKIAANYICDILDKYPVIRAKRLWVEETEEGEFRDMPMEYHNDLIDALSARASMSDVV
ncbi:MAG: CDP-glycerol glycerophosphotransferase family protein [Clostridia bacterium]|nr:CDP-glycerol glycerophosphotransferase family protein [Clostridia bacterium]